MSARLRVAEGMVLGYGSASSFDTDDLFRIALGKDLTVAHPLQALAFSPPGEIAEKLGVNEPTAARIAAMFELGRRLAWNPPQRGQRCQDPASVYELFRDTAHEAVEEFHVVLLDVRCRLIGRRMVARGSLAQCPVAPSDLFRIVLREGAHGVVFVHNHPSGNPEPSVEDAELTARLRAAAEIVGVRARDHVVVASGGFYSFVEAGRWR